MPCRSQGQGASGIIYVLSRDDTAVVASYLKVIQPPTFVMQHCTLAIQLSMQRESAHECKGLDPSTGCARGKTEAARVHKIDCRRVRDLQDK